MKGWLGKLIGDSIKIRAGELDISISSPEEFLFCCSGRTSLPQGRLDAIGRGASKALTDEINQLHRLANTMKKISDPSSTMTVHGFSEVPVGSISQDHNWRDIFEALRGAPPKPGSLLDQCRQMAMEHYLQYLDNRCGAINSVLLARRSEKAAGKDERNSTPVFSPGIVETGLGEVHYERIPKGETVVVKIRPGEDVDLLLSRHKCKLIHENEKLKFISNAQHDPIPIHPGRTAIGRDTINDIVLDAAWRDVSRLHLVINHDGNELQITDMSSYGTFLPIHFIGRDKEALH